LTAEGYPKSLGRTYESILGSKDVVTRPVGASPTHDVPTVCGSSKRGELFYNIDTSRVKKPKRCARVRYILVYGMLRRDAVS